MTLVAFFFEAIRSSTDRSVEEEADHVVITDEELINFWLFGKWTANGKSSSREEGYDSSESD